MIENQIDRFLTKKCAEVRRRDFSRENCLNMWIVADNLRKGAATNAVQIAHYLINKKWVK